MKVEAKRSYLGWSLAKPPGAESPTLTESDMASQGSPAGRLLVLTSLLKRRAQRPAGTLVLQGGLDGHRQAPVACGMWQGACVSVTNLSRLVSRRNV